MSFKYRLQRILELREEALEKIKLAFQAKQQEINNIQIEIHKNHQEQIQIKETLSTGNYELPLSIYSNRMNHLQEEEENLVIKLDQAKQELQEIQTAMLAAQMKVEALVKHKHNNKQEYDEKERLAEEKEMAELALIMRRIRQEAEADHDDNNNHINTYE